MLRDGDKTYLFALIIASILAWASFLSIIFFTNPQSAGLFGVMVLYISFIVGLISVILSLWQLIILRKK